VGVRERRRADSDTYMKRLLYKRLEVEVAELRDVLKELHHKGR
jgi:hypothetical protein